MNQGGQVKAFHVHHHIAPQGTHPVSKVFRSERFRQGTDRAFRPGQTGEPGMQGFKRFTGKPCPIRKAMLCLVYDQWLTWTPFGIHRATESDVDNRAGRERFQNRPEFLWVPGSSHARAKQIEGYGGAAKEGGACDVFLMERYLFQKSTCFQLQGN